MAKYEATTKDNKCIFCEIVGGRIPASVLWENDKHIAFLGIDPNTEGVTCVIPKEHFEANPLTLPNEVLSDLIIASKKTAQILENYYEDVGRVGFVIEGMGINHAHIKLFPMHGTGELKGGTWKQFLSDHKDSPWFPKYDGFITSISGPLANFDELKELSQKIRNSIK